MGLPEQLGALNWDANGGKSFDEGRGSCLRNWECTPGRNLADVVLAWDVLPSGTVAVDIYLGWRQFPIGRCTRGNREFDSDYLVAMHDNKLGQAGRVRVSGPRSDKGAVVDAAGQNGPIDWYYAKLVAVLLDGSFADVRGWNLGSAPYRASGSQPLAPAPAEAIGFVRPPGSREWKTAWEPYGSAIKPG